MCKCICSKHLSFNAQSLKTINYYYLFFKFQADGSLCIFIIDISISNGQPHWLLRALNNLECSEKPLSGMKYSVFTVQAVPLESKADVSTILNPEHIFSKSFFVFVPEVAAIIYPMIL